MLLGIHERSELRSAVCCGDDSGSRGPRIGELEERARAIVVKETLSGAEHEWMDKQNEFVHELIGEQLAHDRATTQDDDILGVPLAKGRDRLR